MTARKPDVDGSCRTHFRTKKRRARAVGKVAIARPISVSPRAMAIREKVQQRIASDLHDSTCQHLIAASLNVMRMRSAIDETGVAARLCDDIDASIDEALREIRAFTYILYPPNLLAHRLKITIEQFVSEFSSRASLEADIEISSEIDSLPIEAQRSVLRVIQEALMNVFRHAKATKVKVAIEATATHFELRVRDNGCGMPVGSAKSAPKAMSPGVGICSMGARLRELGGTLEIYSSSTPESRGSTIYAQIPRLPSRNGSAMPHRRCIRPDGHKFYTQLC